MVNSNNNYKIPIHKSIVLVTCYLGKLPWYFDYYLHSCKYNPTIDFVIVTDDKSYLKKIPENVQLVYKTLEEINLLATNKLGFKTDIKRPYKLCDFKPTYGLIFSELIAEYDFWGYGDIDVIFGNIREFITTPMLNDYDIISVRHDFLTGYFQLFKNTHKMINLFKHSKDYVKVLSSNEHFCFDETNFQHQAFSDKIPIDKIVCAIESMMHVVKKLEAEKIIKAYFDFHVIEGVPGRLKWTNGKLVYRNKYEVILYHLILLKTVYSPKKAIGSIPESFKISPSRIYHEHNSQILVNEL